MKNSSNKKLPTLSIKDVPEDLFIEFKSAVYRKGYPTMKSAIMEFMERFIKETKKMRVS